MAKGQNAAKRYGRDYWSRRYPSAAGCGREGKQLTHRYERRQISRQEHLAERGIYDGDTDSPCVWHCTDDDPDAPCEAL